MSTERLREIHRAMLSAFNADDLRMIVLFDLDERLENIVASGPLSNVAFDLLTWAEAHGRLDELTAALVRSRPMNPQVQALANQVATPAAAQAVGAGDRATLDGPRRSRLRAALLDQYPQRAELAMLLDDTLGESLDEVAGGTNLTETAFELIQWLGIDKERYLRPFLAEAARRRPGSTELTALLREMFGPTDQR